MTNGTKSHSENDFFWIFKTLIISLLGVGKLKKSLVICHFCIFITFCPMKQGALRKKRMWQRSGCHILGKVNMNRRFFLLGVARVCA